MRKLKVNDDIQTNANKDNCKEETATNIDNNNNDTDLMI